MRTRRLRRAVRRAALVVAALAALLLLLRFWPGDRPPIDEPFELIAHRGVHQRTDDRGEYYECTARIHPVQHPYIENTIPSIDAAFDAGATAVEIDIYDTSDSHIIVFHDSTIDCKTNGSGVTREQSLAYLKSLDVGYGYTPDDGKTFPLRGTGVGLMPTLEEVLDRFPGRKLILNQKGRDQRTVEVLAAVLDHYPASVRSNLWYWGARYSELAALVPDIGPSVLLREEIKRCGTAYMRSLGLGSLPGPCAGAVILLPSWALKYLWGWPDRFMQKVVAARSRFVVAEVDSVEAAADLIDLPIHGIMTDRIEVVGPWIRKHARTSAEITAGPR